MSEEVASDTELRLERLIAAPPERVFALWTEPDLVRQWWGPEGYNTPELRLEVRPGGRWRTRMRSPEGATRTVSGVYRTIEAPRRLVFTWGWEDEKSGRGHETEVIVTFDPTPGGTRLVLVQRTFATKEERDRHGGGWSSALGRLARAT